MSLVTVLNGVVGDIRKPVSEQGKEPAHTSSLPFSGADVTH